MPPKDIPMPFRTALPWTGFVALLFLLNYMSRSTLTPLLVSIEEDLGIGHAQATSLLLMQSAGFSSALAASGFLPCRSFLAASTAFSCLLFGSASDCRPAIFLPRLTSSHPV